jgi:tetratricopeptide (TPR) repeat protein
MIRLAAVFFAFLWVARAQEASPSPLSAGDSAFAKGDYAGARQLFEKVLETAPKDGPDSTLRYDLLKRLTSASAAAGRFADAQGYLQQAIALRQSVDDLLLSMNLDVQMKAFDRALATAQRVQAMHVAAYGAASLPVSDDLVRTGQIYLAQTNAVEAMHAFFSAREMRAKISGALDPGLLPALDGFNEACAKIASGGALRGHINEETYRQALAIRETLYGKNSMELLSTVEGLANLYAGEGLLEAAEPLYLRLLALWESAAGKDHPMVAVTLDKLVVFYVKKGEPDKARDALDRSVAIRAHFLAVGLSIQAEDAIAEKKTAQAKALYNRALVALGPAAPDNQESIAAIKKALVEISESH